MRTILAGSRDITDPAELAQAITDAGFAITTVVSGTAKGVDTLGEEYAAAHGLPVERHKPDWSRYGRGAGPQRNRTMAQHADACIVVMRPGSKGSASMVREARKAGLPVHVREVAA